MPCSRPTRRGRASRQRQRQLDRASRLNCDLAGKELQKFCRIDRAGRRLLASARDKLALSARGVHRVLRVARTIADLEMAGLESTVPELKAGKGGDAASSIEMRHLAEALQLRRAID